MRKLVVLLAGVWFGLLLMSGDVGATEARKKLRLAYAEWGIGSAIAYVGIDGGIFNKFNIDIEEIFIKDAFSGGIHALIGADFLLGFGNPLAIVQPILNGADLVLLGSHVNVEKYGMCVAQEINSVRDLKGKKVGVSAVGGRSDLAARVILRRAGLDPVKDVEIVVAGFSPNRAAAITKNLIQGTPLNTDLSAQAKKLGLKVLEVKEVPMVSSLLVSTRSFVKRDEEATRRFLKGYVTAINFYLTKRNESIAIIKKYFAGTDAQSVENMYEAFAAQLKPLPLFNSEALQAMIDTAGVADQRAAKLKPKEMIDSRFLEELQSSGYIEQLYTEKTSL
ncbi:MAG TPA: ABC transporter substrate-binding protein [Candidatus Acidoferrales bacterium]|nr:ABC transporter substrate-binding protein [Candidatus Acidoferrales bacterium]